MSAENQIKRLGNYIMENYPEYIIDGGAGDVAIEIIRTMDKEIKELKLKMLYPR